MTKENIILAALRLFLQRGYKSVSLIDVASEAGITKGGIYHYFSSKEDLLYVSLHFLIEQIEAKYRELLSEQKTLRALLQALVIEKAPENYFKELLQAKGECNLDYVHFAIEAMRRFPDIQTRIEQSHLTICESLAKKIQHAMDSGECRSGFDSFALAATILAMVNGQNSLGSHFQTRAVRQKITDTAFQLLGI